MTTASTSAGTRHAETERPAYPPLQAVSRPTVPTAQCGYYLDRRDQTLRGWACHEDGPLRPIRVNGRLAWSVAEIKRLLGVL